MDTKRIILDEDAFSELLKFQISEFRENGEKKNIFQKIFSFLKPRNNTSLSADMAATVAKWAIRNMKNLRASDTPNRFHIDISDPSREMRLAWYILQEYKRQVLWEKDIPFVTKSWSIEGEDVLIAIERVNWTSLDIQNIGIPVVCVDRAFSKILKELDSSPSKIVKVNVSILMEVHWDISMGRDICMGLNGSRTVMLGHSKMEFIPK